MAWALDKDKQNKRIKKKRDKKGKINNNDILWSMLSVFITNIPAIEITAQQAYDLYKIRWQIELMFKIWKSVLKINVVRKMKAKRFKCYLYSKLLWVLLCWEITARFEPVIWKHRKKAISPHKCYVLIKSKAMQLSSVLFNNAVQLKKWLKKMLYYLADYALKENKKGRKSLEQLVDDIKQTPQWNVIDLNY